MLSCCQLLLVPRMKFQSCQLISVLELPDLFFRAARFQFQSCTMNPHLIIFSLQFQSCKISTELEDYATKKSFLIYLRRSSVLFKMSHMFIFLCLQKYLYMYQVVVIILSCGTLYIDYFISMRNGLSIAIMFMPVMNWNFSFY
jgi:hypothetical protein